jgi:hypothetical protein
MTARGPFHAFHMPDAVDMPERGRAWASRPKRRGVVMATLACVTLIGFALGDTLEWVARFLGSGGPGDPPVSGLVLFVGAAALFWLDRVLFLSSRPAFAMGDEPYDERQAAMAARANRGGLAIAMAVIAGVTVLGAATSSAGYILAFGVAGVALVMSGPQIILAWTLDETEFDFTGDGEIG